MNHTSWLRRRLLLTKPDASRYLAVFLLIAFSLWAFAEIAGEVVEGDSRAFDRVILESMREPGDLSDPLGPLWFEQAVRDVTALGGSTILTLISLAVVGFLSIEKKPKTIAFLIVAIVGGLLISLALKAGFDRPRPDFLTHGQMVYTKSFPSGHSMNSTIVYLTLGSILAHSQRRRAVKIYIMSVAILITTLVGLSRLYLGVHWPTDVLAGWCAGAAWAMMSWLLFRYMQRKRVVEKPAGEDDIAELDRPQSSPQLRPPAQSSE